MRVFKVSQSPASENDLAHFSAKTGLVIPSPLAQFLLSSGNGGHPNKRHAFFVPELVDGGVIHSVIGVNNEEKLYDLQWHLELPHNAAILKDFLPFALDDGGGQLLICKQGPEYSIWYRPWDMIDDPLEQSVFAVAPNMDMFLDTLLTPDELTKRIEDARRKDHL